MLIKSRKEFVIIGGANGSGKTTFARSCLKNHAFEYICADEIAIELNPDNSEKAKIEAGKEFFQRLDRCIELGKSMLVESTLSGVYLHNIIFKSKSLGYKTTIIYVYLENPVVCIERIKERVLKGGHHVPSEDVVRRYHRSKYNFWYNYKNESDYWYLIYNAKDSFQRFALGKREIYVISNQGYFDKFKKGLNIS